MSSRRQQGRNTVLSKVRERGNFSRYWSGRQVLLVDKPEISRISLLHRCRRRQQRKFCLKGSVTTAIWSTQTHLQSPEWETNVFLLLLKENTEAISSEGFSFLSWEESGLLSFNRYLQLRLGWCALYGCSVVALCSWCCHYLNEESVSVNSSMWTCCTLNLCVISGQIIISLFLPLGCSFPKSDGATKKNTESSHHESIISTLHCFTQKLFQSNIQGLFSHAASSSCVLFLCCRKEVVNHETKAWVSFRVRLGSSFISVSLPVEK